jgi:hypothetical protein
MYDDDLPRAKPKKRKKPTATTKLNKRVSKLEKCVKDKDERIQRLEKRPERVVYSFLLIGAWLLAAYFLYWLNAEFPNVIRELQIITSFCVAAILSAFLIGLGFLFIWADEFEGDEEDEGDES